MCVDGRENGTEINLLPSFSSRVQAVLRLQVPRIAMQCIEAKETSRKKGAGWWTEWEFFLTPIMSV